MSIARVFPLSLQIPPSQIRQAVANITGEESFMKKNGIKVEIILHSYCSNQPLSLSL